MKKIVIMFLLFGTFIFALYGCSSKETVTTEKKQATEVDGFEPDEEAGPFDNELRDGNGNIIDPGEQE